MSLEGFESYVCVCEGDGVFAIIAVTLIHCQKIEGTTTVIGTSVISVESRDDKMICV